MTTSSSRLIRAVVVGQRRAGLAEGTLEAPRRRWLRPPHVGPSDCKLLAGLSAPPPPPAQRTVGAVVVGFTGDR